MEKSNAPSPKDLVEGTKWFRHCTTLEDVDKTFIDHLNAFRWEVLNAQDMAEIRKEYWAMVKAAGAPWNTMPGNLAKSVGGAR